MAVMRNMAREAEAGAVTILSVLHFDVATVFLLLPVSYPLCEMHTDYSFFRPCQTPSGSTPLRMLSSACTAKSARE